MENTADRKKKRNQEGVCGQSKIVQMSIKQTVSLILSNDQIYEIRHFHPKSLSKWAVFPALSNGLLLLLSMKLTIVRKFPTAFSDKTDTLQYYKLYINKSIYKNITMPSFLSVG